MEGSPQAAAIFVAMVPAALVAIMWPGLRPGHALILPLVLGLTTPLVSYVLAGLMPVFGQGILDPTFLSFSLADYWSSDPIPRGWRIAPLLQIAVSVVTATGLWMGARNQGILVRRTADDREELDQLYELLPASDLPKPISRYRLQCLLADSRSVTAEFRGQRLGVLPVFSAGPELLVLPAFAEQGAIRTMLLAQFMRRLEVQFVDAIMVAAADRDSVHSDLVALGFTPLPADDQDLDHIVKVRKCLAKIGQERLHDPEYFDSYRHVYRRGGAVSRDE